MGTCKRNTYVYDGSVMSVILSIIFGVVVGALFYYALLPAITTGVIIAAALAGLVLVLFWISALMRKYYSDNDCVCQNIGTLLTGIFGTIVSSFIALSVALEIATMSYAILIGLVGFFFALTITGAISYLNCKADCDCDCNCD